MINFFNNLGMMKKMLAASTIMLFVILGLSYGTYYGLSSQQRVVDDLYNNRFVGYQNSAKILNTTSDIHISAYKVLNWANAGYDVNKINEFAGQQKVILLNNIKFVEEITNSAGLTATEKQLYETALQQLKKYQEPSLGVMEMAPMSPQAATMYMADADEKYVVLASTLNKIAEYEQRLSKDKYDYSRDSYHTVLTIFLLVAAISIVLSIFISVMIARQMTARLQESIDVIMEVAEGDLTQQIDVDSGDEIGELAQAFNAMRINMGDAVGQALCISHSLAKSASMEASSIEETSASVEEMAGMTSRNASNTQEANKLMLIAVKEIEKANTSMSDLKNSMAEIVKASADAQKIVNSIDEIAFQTNLLALNAAVEAARAGEAGAGFAIVADEVRNLAMRSTEAAKSTTVLIEGIASKIKMGREFVGRTSEAFSEVGISSQKVRELMDEITAASKEQAVGVEQINRAINEMNISTQKNAASAQELAASMSIFKTENGQESSIDGKAFLANPKKTPKLLTQ